MSIVINGDGSISGISVGGLPDGTVDAGTLATDSVTAAKLKDDAIAVGDLPAGSVLQVVQASTTTKTQTTTDGSWVSVEPSASITPSSTSSKILILHSAGGCASAGGSYGLRIMRDSTEIRVRARHGYGGDEYLTSVNFDTTYLDSPSTTSAVTYSFDIYISASGGSVRHNDDAGHLTEIASATTILMEIAG